MSDDNKKEVPAVLSLVSLFTYFGMLIGAMALLAGTKIFTTSEGFAIGIQLALFFPCGLGGLCGEGSRGAGLAILISYASFIAFLVAFIRVRSWATYGLLCVGFSFLLIMNVAGCREMHKGLSGITMMPNKSPEPTAVGAVRSAVAVHVASRRWLSFFR